MQNKLYFGILFLVIHLGFSQKIHRCVSDEYMQNEHANNPTIKIKRQFLNDQFIQKKRINQYNDIVEIPVVIHVLYRTAKENVSDAQIQSQIKVLNEDYRKLNANVTQTISQFSNLATDSKIQFKLATVDPQGNPTTGVIRKQTSKTGFDYTTNEAKKTNLGGSNPWDPSRYLNIWVVNVITFQGVGGTLGYAQFPEGDPATDGVVIVYNAFGSTGPLTPPYDGGRTATHEIGHWLGLYHLWGKVSDGKCDQLDDDLIVDTPLQAESSANCELNKTSCGNLNMVQNFMDYSNDDCMTLFTKGQVDRMRDVLNTTRTGFLPNDEYEYDVAISTIQGIESDICDDQLSSIITVKNHGTKTLTSLELTLKLNNQTIVQETYSTSLKKGETQQITIPSFTMPVFGNQQAQIIVDLPNGKTDENPQNNEQVKSFKITNGESIQFSISEDSKNDQMTWKIQENGQTVFSHTQVAITSNNGMSIQNMCLAKNECYEFSLENAFVSDLCSQYQEWNSATTYQIGDRFVYKGNVYEATATIWGVDPISFYQYFNDLGPCPTPNPTDKFELKNLNKDEIIVTQQVNEHTGNTTKSFCISIVSNLQEKENQQIIAYPNPTQNGKIYLSQQVKEVYVFDVYGKEVFRENAVQEVQLKDKGIYFLHIVSIQGLQMVKVVF